jgi:hypothetical protein
MYANEPLNTTANTYEAPTKAELPTANTVTANTYELPTKAELPTANTTEEPKTKVKFTYLMKYDNNGKTELRTENKEFDNYDQFADFVTEVMQIPGCDNKDCKDCHPTNPHTNETKSDVNKDNTPTNETKANTQPAKSDVNKDNTPTNETKDMYSSLASMIDSFLKVCKDNNSDILSDVLYSPDCDCPTCSAYKKTEAKTESTQPTSNVNKDNTPTSNETKAKTESTQPAKSSPTKFSDMLKNLKCDCSVCSAYKNNAAKESNEAKSTTQSNSLSYMLDLFLSYSANKYYGAAGSYNGSRHDIPLLNKKIKIINEKNDLGASGTFKALANSVHKTVPVVCDVNDIFDLPTLETLVNRKTRKFNAHVRLEEWSRTNSRQGLFDSFHGPALVETFKVYLQNSIPNQDVVRFHEDGFGYDVYC